MVDATDNALAQANAQMASVREMVAALEVDYDRLEELRETLRQLRIEFESQPENAGVDFDNWARNQIELTSDEFDELAELEAAAGDCESEDDARERITCDALSVEVRSDWHSVGGDSEPTEFRIVLCTGGPHVQIVGELAQGEPSRAWLEYRDWGTGLTERVNQDSDQDALLAYARQFYFGE